MAASNDKQAAGYAYNSQGEVVVSTQPPPTPYAATPGGQVQFMPRPAAVAGVPPGLEYLTQIDQLLVHQQVELFEILTGYEMNNKYQVKNTLGQQVFFAAEESGCCMRYWCGPARGFVLHITDNFGQEVIRVVRNFKCCAGCNCCAGTECCSMEIQVEAPVGQVIGYMKQQKSCLATKYIIQDAEERTIFLINGPTCPCQGLCCRADVEFLILSPDGLHQVGVISKQWGGVFREMVADADNFSVAFPMDLDVRMKATLLGAVFLIDFMLFETQKNNNN
jgi:hypothetical protein